MGADSPLLLEDTLFLSRVAIHKKNEDNSNIISELNIPQAGNSSSHNFSGKNELCSAHVTLPNGQNVIFASVYISPNVSFEQTIQIL